MVDAPPLSVVIASATTLDALDVCLTALRPQAAEVDAEVVVADATGADPETIVDSRAGIRVLAFPVGTPTPILWGAALAEARAPLLAVTDATSVPASGWVRAALAAPSEAAPIVGGVVEPPTRGSMADWTAYFCEYAQFMRPLASGQARELPGNNVVFRRDLLAIGTSYTTPGFWKTYWCGELTAAGVPLTVDPTMAVRNAKRYRFAGFLRRRYRHGRCFGGMRTRGVSKRQHVVWTLTAPAVPFVLFSRVVRNVVPKRRHRGRLLAALPGLFLSAASWGLGEGVGYLAGPGETCRDLA